jgi:hypothetical protein
MQHVILVLAMMLLLGIAAKEVSVTKEAAVNKLMQIEKVQEKKDYQLSDEDDDIYKSEFSIGSCYTDLFQ